MTLLAGCDISDSDPVQRVLGAFSRWNDGCRRPCSAHAAGADIPRTARGKGFPLQRLVRAGQRATARCCQIPAATCRADRRQAALDRRAASRAAAGNPDHAPCLRRGLEHDRQMDRHAAAHVPGTDRRRHHGKICRVRMRRRLLRGDGHAQRVAPADHHGVPAGRRDPARRYGYPFKIRVPTKLGFKNPKFVTTLYVTNQQPRGFWTDRGYNWFSGI